MGVSTALWNMVRACLNAGMRKETILSIIKGVTDGVPDDPIPAWYAVPPPPQPQPPLAPPPVQQQQQQQPVAGPSGQNHNQDVDMNGNQEDAEGSQEEEEEEAGEEEARDVSETL